MKDEEEREHNDEDGVSFWPTQSLSLARLVVKLKLLSTTSSVGCRSRRPPPR